MVYFGGMPVAILQGTTYTDLLYAGEALLAEVSGMRSPLPLSAIMPPKGWARKFSA
jgi:hypothetical protein